MGYWVFALLMILTAIVGMLLMIPNTNSAFACECAPPVTPAEELDRSAAVFTGEVVGIHENQSRGAYEVKFDVEKTLKGEFDKTAVIFTALGSAACGYEFEDGERYLVYAYASNGSLETTICNRTALLADAQEDLDILETAWLIYKVNVDDQTFKIPYRFSNGHLSGIEVDPDFTEIIASIETYVDGTFEISVPRNLLDPKFEMGGGPDDEFIVLVDGEEPMHEEINKSPCFRTLSIPVPRSAEEIEIIATSVMGTMVSKVPPIYFTTEKVIDYIRGEEIKVSGCTNLALDDKEVLLEVLDPEGKVYKTMSVIPNRDGSFSASFVVEGELAATETYTVQATYAGYTVIPEFPVSLIILGISFVGLIAAARLLSSTNKHNVY